jgi:uncharacterized protein
VTVAVRPNRDGDRSGLRALADASTPRFYATLLHALHGPEEDGHRWKRTRVTVGPDGSVAGAVTLAHHSIHRGQYALVVGVRAEHRRQGLGRALVDEARRMRPPPSSSAGSTSRICSERSRPRGGTTQPGGASGAPRNPISGRLWAGGSVHELVASRRAQIEALCRRLGVRRLDLFGSALGDRFDEQASDIDVLVEFSGGPGFDHFGAYFALKDGLEEIFGRPVDVVSATAIRNPYFRDEVMRTREPLYAA